MKFYLFLLLSLPSFCLAQDASKNEIAKYLINSASNESPDSFFIKTGEGNNELNVIINNYISNYESKKIDSFGFFKIYSPVFHRPFNCLTGTMNPEIFIFWIINNKFYFKQFSDQCKTEKIQINKLTCFDFFINNFNSISLEWILPVIYSAKKEDNNMKFDGEINMHDKVYSIYIQANSKRKYLEFSQNALENPKGLFYVDNISTSIFHLFKILQAEVNVWKDIFHMRR